MPSQRKRGDAAVARAHEVEDLYLVAAHREPRMRGQRDRGHGREAGRGEDAHRRTGRTPPGAEEEHAVLTDFPLHCVRVGSYRVRMIR